MTEQTPQNITEQIANAAVAQAAQIPVEQVQAAMNDAQMPQNVPQGAQTTQPTQQTQAQPMAPQMGAMTPQQVPPMQVTGAAQTQTNRGSQPVQTNYQVAQAPGIQQIIDQQNAQIQALMQQNAALNSQVVSLVQNGGQLTGAQAPQQTVQQPIQPNPQYPTQVQQMAQLGAQPDPFAGMTPPSLSSTEDYSLEGLAAEIGKSEGKK